MAACTGEDMEKEKNSSPTDGIAKSYNHSGNQFDSSSENWKFTQKIIHHTTRTHVPVCSLNLIHNSQKLKATQFSPNQRMDTENLVHFHY